MNLYSKNAKFEDVIASEEALAVHVMKYEMGFRYKLAIACYQYDQSRKERDAKNTQS